MYTVQLAAIRQSTKILGRKLSPCVPDGLDSWKVECVDNLVPLGGCGQLGIMAVSALTFVLQEDDAHKSKR